MKVFTDSNVHKHIHAYIKYIVVHTSTNRSREVPNRDVPSVSDAAEGRMAV